MIVRKLDLLYIHSAMHTLLRLLELAWLLLVDASQEHKNPSSSMPEIDISATMLYVLSPQ